MGIQHPHDCPRPGLDDHLTPLNDGNGGMRTSKRVGVRIADELDPQTAAWIFGVFPHTIERWRELISRYDLP
jgi:hypothetical protein